MSFDHKTFGRRIIARRKELGISQAALSKRLGTSTSVIGRYERGTMTPSVEAAAKIAEELETTVGYLLGETEQAELFKDPAMLRRLDAIEELAGSERERLLYLIDAVLRDTQTRRAYAA